MNFCETMSEHEELLFRSLVKDLQKSNLEETIFIRLMQEYKEMCYAKNVMTLSSFAAFRILIEMSSYVHRSLINFISLKIFSDNFISLIGDCGQMNRRIALNMALSEAQFCIRQLDLRDSAVLN